PFNAQAPGEARSPASGRGSLRGITDRRGAAAAAEGEGARAERDPCEDQCEGAEGVRRQLLAEEDDAVDDRERRHEVRGENRPARSGTGEERVVDEVRERRRDEPE